MTRRPTAAAPSNRDMGPTIHHLNCGTMCPRGQRLLSGRGGWLAPARLVCHVLLVEASDGLVLVDTGFGTGDIERPAQLSRRFLALTRPDLAPAETAAAQVRRLGFRPEDVRHIVLTHLDVDHAGGLPDFPRAQVHVWARELQAMQSPPRGERQRYRIGSQHFSHGPKWVEHVPMGDHWLGFEGVRVLSGSDTEILLIPLAGHTLGHAAVAVPDGPGWLLHCGDAYFHHAEVATSGHCPPGLRAFQTLMQADGRLRRSNQERLRALAARHPAEVRLICSHDPHDLDGARR